MNPDGPWPGDFSPLATKRDIGDISTITDGSFGALFEKKALVDIGIGSPYDGSIAEKTNLLHALRSLPEGLVLRSEEHRNESTLEERASATAATKIVKAVNGCGNLISANEPINRYPAFPSSATKNWAALDGGRWTSIASYYGNATADCTDWSIAKLATADTVYTAQGVIRADYQTEHVLEGQSIGLFFTSWLDTGRVPNQPLQITLAPAKKLSCDWTTEYVEESFAFDIAGFDNLESLSTLLMSELGSISHLDRLTILMTRPNGIKGSLFGGKRGINPDRGGAYRSMTAEEQLLAVKDLGMVFSYMNDANVWAMFCATFEAIYSDLEAFDDIIKESYGDLGTTLAAEWSTYMRATLDTVVVNARSLFDQLYAARRGSGLWEPRWNINRYLNKPRIRLPGTCTHLSGTTV